MPNESIASATSDIEFSECVAQLSHRSNCSGAFPSSDQACLLENDGSKVGVHFLDEEATQQGYTSKEKGSKITFVIIGSHIAGGCPFYVPI